METGDGETWIESDADAVRVGDPVSVARAVKENAPAAEGVPENTPVEGSSESPGGRLPETTLHE